MIPVKIISQKEAVKRGWTNEEETDHGNAVVGGGGVAEKGPDGKEVLTETSIIRANGQKEIIFMHEKRKKEMEKRGHLGNYVKNFDKIEGIEKETYIKNNKLVITQDQEVEEKDGLRT